MSTHPLDDLAAYAMDALDAAERDAVAAHLSYCLECRDELDAHYETLAALSPDEIPPAAVWQRVTASIGADAVVRPMPPRPVPSRVGWVAAAAAVVVALAVGGGVGFAVGNTGGDGSDIGSLAQQASDELATLHSPGGDPVARVVADEDGAYLVLEGLEDLPEGRAYQLWSLTESQPVSLGMLGRDGTNTVAFRLPPTITELAITEAPTSGDVTPNGRFLAEGQVTHT